MSFARRSIMTSFFVVSVSGCGVTESELTSQGTTTDCERFESAHLAFWNGYQSLPDSYEVTTNSLELMLSQIEGSGVDQATPEFKTVFTTKEERQVKGVESAHGTIVRQWPLVEDETLQYLMKSMAEAADQGIWRRNFISASSYCNLSGMP